MPVVRESEWRRMRATSPWAQRLLLIFALALLGVAVTVPWYTRPRENARQASCLSNMKSLALATLTYAHDWDGRLPPCPTSPAIRTLTEGVGATADLARFLPPDDWRRQIRYRNDQVFFCPSTRSIYSYDFNAHVYGTQLKQLREPQHTVLEYEAGLVTGLPPGPHFQGYNATFCDGHAKWVKGLREAPGVTLDGEMKP